jgi:hypothetical protein
LWIFSLPMLHLPVISNELRWLAFYRSVGSVGYEFAISANRKVH